MVRSERQTEKSPKADLGCRLEQAFAEHQAQLLGTLFYMVGNLEDARDALQDVFIKCWKHREELDSIENLKGWIFRIAFNTGKDLRGTAWRRRRQSMEGLENMWTSRDGSPDVLVERNEQVDLLRQAMATLRAEEQEIFLLRQNGELTYEEIGETLKIPVGTVKTRMRLALTKLREVLDKGQD